MGIHQGDVLVVDDNPANLDQLEQLLQDRGYAVRAAPNGRLAIESARRRPPDIVLLDIMMPEMDGFETCRRLKAIPEVAPAPVLFISALSDIRDKSAAFAAGGVDFITKPFDLDEVMIRLHTHLELYRLQQILRRNARSLEQKVEIRGRELLQQNARLQEELVEQRRRLSRYQEAFRQAPSMLALLRAEDWAVIETNAAFAEFAGQGLEAQGASAAGPLTALRAELERSGAASRMPLEFPDRAGRPHPWMADARPLTDAEGRPFVLLSLEQGPQRQVASPPPPGR